MGCSGQSSQNIAQTVQPEGRSRFAVAFCHIRAKAYSLTLALDREGMPSAYRTPVRLMATPPQFSYSESDSLAVAQAKTTLKALSPEARAHVMAWLVKYYTDDGAMFSPQITRGRKKATIDDVGYWLVKVPTK